MLKFKAFLVLAFLLLMLSACAQKPVNNNLNEAKAAERNIIAAKAYMEKNNTRKALTHLQKAERFESKSVELFLAYAFLYKIENDPKREEHYYRKALSVDKKNSRVKNNYGSFLCFHDETKKGLRFLTDASEDYFYQSRAEAYINRGLCEKVMGDLTAAEKSFQQSIRLNTRSSEPFLELSAIYFEKNDLHLASMYHRQYMNNQSQQDVRALLLGAKIAKGQQDNTALRNYGLLLEKLYPNSSEYKEYLNMIK